MNEVLTAVVASLIVAAIVFVAKKLRDRWDRRRVHSWLAVNTVNKSNEGHVATIAIAKGAGIAEERVRLACLSDLRIYRAPGVTDSWSVWNDVPGRSHLKDVVDTTAEATDQWLLDSQSDTVFIEVIRQQPKLRPSLGGLTTASMGDIVRIQHFERGFLFWHLNDADRIVVAFDETQTWYRWHDVAAPLGLSNSPFASADAAHRFFKTTGGFLRCWLANGLAERLGSPQEFERDLEPPVLYKFANGVMLRNIPWWDRTDKIYGELPVGFTRVLVLVGEQAGTWEIPSVQSGPNTAKLY